MHLHAFFGAKTGLEISKVIVSYVLIIVFSLFMFYYVSRVYNTVDRFFAHAETKLSTHSAVIKDMLFEEQGAIKIKPTLKAMKQDFRWIRRPTNETAKTTKLISVLPKEYVPLGIGYHYDRRDADNMIRAIEQRVAVTNLTDKYRLDVGLAHREAKKLSDRLRPLCTEEFVFPFRDNVVKWLEARNYTSNRKTQILKAYDEAKSLMADDLLKQRAGRVEAFIKEEYYPEYKNPRAILARGDLAKAIFGPLS